MNVIDWLGSDNKLGQDIWEKKYRYNDESFEEWLNRVSGNNEEYKNLIISKKFLPGGRILANRGLNKLGQKVTYSNCYVIPSPEDNIESIFDCAKAMARTFSYGGGVGIDISKLAPKGAKVNNTAKETSGSVSFMDLYSMVTGLIGQNGRRGALMISLACDHPDIEEFIEIKSDLDKITKANISIRVTKEFMEAVINNRDFKLSFTREETGEVIEKLVKASELFDKMCYMNWDYAEPGILFWDRIESWNLLSNNPNFKYDGTNPCLVGETLIQTTEGLKQIKDLVGQEFDVYCMDDNGNLTISHATKAWKTRENAQTVTVVTGKGIIKCTPDHRIYTTNRGWVEAKDLKRGDKIKGLNRSMKDEKHVSVCLSGGKYIPEHRFVLGHYQNIEGLDVHHLDDDTLNNAFSNLKALTHSEHSVLTNTDRHTDVIRDEKGCYVEKENKKKRDSFNQNKKVGTNWYVKDIYYNDELVDVYDITVPEFHNFVANDMIVHNCAEEPLPAGGSCLLGSINLAEFVTKNKKFNCEDFTKTVRTSVRFLNDILEEGMNLHPLEIQKQTVNDWKQIGLGTMGLADMLIKMEIPYGSFESLQLCDEIGRHMIETAIDESSELAKELGAYPKYTDDVISTPFFKSNVKDSKIIDKVKQYGLRNSQLLTCAPTGTLSTLLQISGGIEPIFANYYTRKTQSLHGKDTFYKVYTPIVKKYMDENNISNDKDLPDWFVTSSTIKPADRIAMQSTWQKYIDASISSTINLPNESTQEEVKNIYIQAYKNGLKGVTVYRAECKREGVLVEEPKEPKKEEKVKLSSYTSESNLPWGTVLGVDNDLVGMKRKIINGCGAFHLQAFYDEFEGRIWETFVSLGDGGGCERNLEFISKLISKCLRAGVSIDEIIDTAKSIRPCVSFCNRTRTKKDTSPGTSCPSAIGNALEDFKNKIKQLYTYQNLDESSDDSDEDNNENVEINKNNSKELICPECGNELHHEGGCIICSNCGWSKCN